MHFAHAVECAFELVSRPAFRTDTLECDRMVENHELERVRAAHAARRHTRATRRSVAGNRRNQRLECSDSNDRKSITAIGPNDDPGRVLAVLISELGFVAGGSVMIGFRACGVLFTMGFL